MRSTYRRDYISRRLAIKSLLNAGNEVKAICDLYSLEMMSTGEISDKLAEAGISITARSLQRIIKRQGIKLRDSKQSFNLAIARGRKVFKKRTYTSYRKRLSDKLRYKILKRDNFKCVSCGNTAQTSILEVHHIVPYKIIKEHKEDNLQTLCEDCHNGID